MNESQCQCILKSGNQCTRVASTKAGINKRYCWQHQNCDNEILDQKKGITTVKELDLEIIKNLDWDSIVTLMMTNNYLFRTIFKILPQIIAIQTVDELKDFLLAFSKIIGRKEIKTLLSKLLPQIISKVVKTFEDINKFLEMGRNFFLNEDSDLKVNRKQASCSQELEMLKLLLDIGKINDESFIYDKYAHWDRFHSVEYSDAEFFENVGFLLYRVILSFQFHAMFLNEYVARWDEIILLKPERFHLYSPIEFEFKDLLLAIYDATNPEYREELITMFNNKVNIIAEIAHKYKYIGLSQLLIDIKHDLNKAIENNFEDEYEDDDEIHFSRSYDEDDEDEYED